MDSFETLIAMLLRHQGYWTTQSYKVELTKEEKERIGKRSSPRWEVDVLAYKGGTNELLVVECKSFLDSGGVEFRAGQFTGPDRYKLFNDSVLRAVVLNRLREQLVKCGACPATVTPRLCLAAGKLSSKTDLDGLWGHFEAQGWRLFDPAWMKERLETAARQCYENDVAFVVSKLLLR